MKISNKTYDILKWVSMVFLPAFTTFYGVIGATCGIPYTQEVLTIMVASDAFLGSLLKISTNNYTNEAE